MVPLFAPFAPAAAAAEVAFAAAGLSGCCTFFCRAAACVLGTGGDAAVGGRVALEVGRGGGVTLRWWGA